MKKFIALGTVVFAFSLLIYIPSASVAKLLPNNITAMQFYGNVWQGSAADLKINHIELGNIEWKIKPSCFIAFKLCAQIAQQHDNLQSQFELELRNRIKLHDVTAEGNAMILNTLLQRYGITSSGEFKADLDIVSFSRTNVDEIDGQINFTPLVLNGVVRVHMGNVNSNFESFDDHTMIIIDNDNGHLDLNGAIKVFDNLTYHADMLLKQNERSPEMITNGLRYVGSMQTDGSVHLNQKGRLTI
jgi:hypothetical protein